MQSAIVQIRVEPALKQKAAALFQSIGLDTATAIRLFFTQSLLKGNIPFEITANSITATPRKGWAEAFSKAKKKEQMLIPETINNDEDQIIAIDKMRLVKVLGKLEAGKIKEVKNLLNEMLVM